MLTAFWKPETHTAWIKVFPKKVNHVEEMLQKSRDAPEQKLVALTSSVP